MDFRVLYAELSNSTEIIRALLSGISQEEASRKPSPGSWSILEVTCHLHDEEREDFRKRLNFILHDQTGEYPLINPQKWVTERNYNQQNFDEMKEKFFTERQQSLDWLEEISDSDWNTIYRFKNDSVTAGEMFASWVAHDNLHIRQLVELRRHRIESITQPYPIGYAGDW